MVSSPDALRGGTIPAATVSAPVPGQRPARWALAFVYVSAGILHITLPAPFLTITPDWVPFPREVIFGTGLCELAGAAGLLTSRFRRAAGFALALYAVCVYPANIKHAIDDLGAARPHLGWWYHAPRLALQPVLVWWPLFAAGITAWPFGRRLS